MAQIYDEKYYMEMPTDFDYRVMEGIVRACSRAGSEWEGIVDEYNRGKKYILFDNSYGKSYGKLYPEKCLAFITEVSQKLDSCAQSMKEMREQLMNVEFEATAYLEDCNCNVECYCVVRENGRATVLDGSGVNPSPHDTGEFESYEEFLRDMEGRFIQDDDRPTDVICREIWPEGQDNPYREYCMNCDGDVYIHGDPEIEWEEVGDLYQIEYTNGLISDLTPMT